MSTTFKIPSSVLFNGQTIKQPVPKSATSVLATNLPSIAQKLAELQEINTTSLRISHLKAVISKQDEKIAGILQDVEMLMWDTQRRLGEAYSIINKMYVGLPLVEDELRGMGVTEQAIGEIMARRCAEIGKGLEMLDWVGGCAERACEDVEVVREGRRWREEERRVMGLEGGF